MTERITAITLLCPEWLKHTARTCGREAMFIVKNEMHERAPEASRRRLAPRHDRGRLGSLKTPTRTRKKKERKVLLQNCKMSANMGLTKKICQSCSKQTRAFSQTHEVCSHA